MSYGVDDHMGARVDLEELAMKALTYNLAAGESETDIAVEVNTRLHDQINLSMSH